MSSPLPADPEPDPAAPGPRYRLTPRLAVGLLRRGILNVAHPTHRGAWRETLLAYLGARALDRLARPVARLRLAVAALLRRDRPAAPSRAAAQAAGRPDSISRADPGPDILLVNGGLAWGGAERQVLRTAEGLRARGYDARLLVEGLDGERGFFAAEAQRLGIPVTTIAAAAGGTLEGLPAEVRAGLDRLPRGLAADVAWYAAAFARLRPRLVHGWQDLTNLRVGLAADLCGIERVVLGVRNLAPPRFRYYDRRMRPLYRRLRAGGAVLVANAAAGARDYGAWLGGPALPVLRNGVEPITPADPERVAALRARLGLPVGTPVVGTIARLYPEKDPGLFVATVRRVLRADPGARALLVGEGPLRAAIHRAGADLGDRLLLPGALPASEALALMDVFLLTSRAEGTPNVVLEAQAAGLPVVATRAGGTEEALLDGVTGRLCPRDRRALSDACRAVLTDGELRRQAATLGPRFVADRYGMARMVDETLALYGLPARRAADPGADTDAAA